MDREGIFHLARLLGSKVGSPNGKNVLLQCPLAPITHEKGTDRNPGWSILVSPDGPSTSHCWACSAAGSVADVLARAVSEGISGLDEAAAWAREHDRGGLLGAMRGGARGGGGAPRMQLRDAGADLASYLARCGRLTSQYVIDRGLVASDINAWKIGYDEGPTIMSLALEEGGTVSRRVHHRVTFPIWDERGVLVGASLRSTLPEEADPPKYWDTPGLPKKEVFYGEHRVDTTIGEGNLVEGILDTIVASRYLPNVLGIMGAKTGMGPRRIEKLRRWFSRINLILDGDKAGEEAVAGHYKTFKRKDGSEGQVWVPGLLDQLRPYLPVRVVKLPSGHDPADLAAALVPHVRQARYIF